MHSFRICEIIDSYNFDYTIEVLNTDFIFFFRNFSLRYVDIGCGGYFKCCLLEISTEVFVKR